MNRSKPKLINLYDIAKVPPVTAHSVIPPTPALLTITEAAAHLGVGEVTVRGWVVDGTIYSLSLGATGRVKRIPAGEIERIRNLGYMG